MPIALDTETTTFNFGNAFDNRNKLVCFSIADAKSSGAVLWDSHAKECLQLRINSERMVIGFNFKFDAHWFIKEGISLDGIQIWDVQTAHFLMSNQTHRFPSLNEVAEHWGLSCKLDVVKTEYWDKGIDTDKIPWPILEEYAAHDAYLTYQCYVRQFAAMNPAQRTLCFLMGQDLLVLQDMEMNGLAFDEKLCEEESVKLDARIKEITTYLESIYPQIPINFGSNDHLSAFLYGGIVKEDGKEFVGYFKSGQKVGQPKYKNVIIEHRLPGMYKPIKGSEMAKVGNYSVSEDTLRKLKGNKKIVDLLLELAKLEKLNGTYYRGLVKLRKEKNWEPGVLHGQFNQCIAQTGRLSSSSPNLQNFASDLQNIFITTYGD